MSLCQDGIRGWNHFALKWIIFNFVELFSFTWVLHNCVKWCFDLHVECCGSCMVSTIAVESGKIFGVLKIFARMFSNLPEKFWATLPTNFFPQRSWRPFFGMTSGWKKVFMYFSSLYEIKQGWAPFLPRFSDILPRFSRILPGFSINQNLQGCLCTPPPTLLVSTEFSTWQYTCVITSTVAFRCL